MLPAARPKKSKEVQEREDPATASDQKELPPFKATPEVISQFLEIKTEEVLAQLKSVEGRTALFQKLMEHQDALQKIHAFDPEELRRQLEVSGEAVVAKEKFFKDVQSPEKKGMFRRAWEKVKAFPRKHPIVTALLVAALVAGGYVAWQYYGHVVMAWLHTLGESAPMQVLKDMFGGSAGVPSAPKAPTEIIDAWRLPPGKG